MRRTVIVRTHYADPSLEAMIAALSPVGDVLVVADETEQPVDIRNAPKLGLTLAAAEDWGVFAGVPRIFWRCGDYSLFAARQLMPNKDFFWMIEPDVRLSFDDFTQFFDHFDAHCAADFVAARLAPAAPDWDWAPSVGGRYASVWQCLFPLVRLSGKAIDFLLEQRRADTAARGDKDPDSWPNDEAFTATTLANNGFSLADFNEFGTFYSAETLSFWSPIAESAFRAKPPDGMIHHPVLSGRRLFEKLFYIALCKQDLPGLLASIAALTGREWPDADAAAYRQIVEAAQQSLPR
jgi:hypothetical protein